MKILCNEVETVMGFSYLGDRLNASGGCETALTSRVRIGTWCLGESEMAILRRTERAMVRSMCGVKIEDRKNTEELMEILNLKKTLDRTAKANGARWYGHVIRREDDNILKKAVMMKVNGQRKRGQPK